MEFYLMVKITNFFKDYIWIFSFVLLSSALILLFSTQKIDYHIDELLTYNLSNSTSFNVDPGEKYESYGNYQEKFLTTSEETRFDYQTVWKNQANDVHPPFYYVIIHTISSFIPGEFSKYIGIGVNLIFNALIILFLYKFSFKITNNKTIASITSLFWAVNPGVISDMMFIRMYVMTMFFCLLISYAHFKNVSNITWRNYKFYLTLFFISLAGTLTHYYFLVFTFFLCALFVLLLLYKKKFKELLMYVGTYIVTIVSALTIFPSIYHHMLGGERGVESIDNFTSTNGYLETLKTFWNVISNNLFGGYLSFIALIIPLVFIALLLPIKRFSKGDIASESLWKIVFLIIPCTLYFLLISNIAVYTVERYIQPIFPLIILIIISLVYIVIQIFLSKKVSIVFTCTLLILVGINGYISTTSFEYLESDSKEALKVSEHYSDKDVIFIYDRTWKIIANYLELANYNSVTFYRTNELESLYQNTNYNEFVLYSHVKDESMVQFIVNKLPNIESYEKLNNFGYTEVYYLH
jgi:uncharacterized membrane protein